MQQSKFMQQQKSIVKTHLRWIFLSMLFAMSTSSFAQFTKSGTVYEDYNANKVINSGEPGTNAGSALCAYLINNTSNVVLQSQSVGAAGTFSFNVAALSGGASYIVAIGNCGIATGTVFTGGSSAYNSFLNIPAGWSVVDPADNKWKTAGNATNSTNIFFIRKLPAAANMQSQVFACSPSGCISIPALSGTAATGNSAYAIENYQVITIPAGGTLKSGSNTITAGETITASQAASLCFQKNTGAAGSMSFTYVAIDNAGGNDYLSDIAQYIIRLGGVGFRRDAPSGILLACNSQPATLYAPFTTDTTGSTFTYSWTGPGGFISTMKTPVLAANTAVEDGLYIVTATDQSGCASKDTLKTKKMECFASCDGGNAYMVKGTGSTNGEKLYKYNLTTGVTTTVSSSLTSMDAVCYNIHNNLIYGWAEGNSPTQHIYALDMAGKQVDLGKSADASSYQDVYFAGTAAPDGTWYMATGQDDAIFKIMDIDPLSPNYMRYAGQTVASGGTFDPWDFAWSQCDSMIYGVSDTKLYKMNPVTGVITKYNATISGGNGSYGAQWMDNNCDLFISDSQNGKVYKASLGSFTGGTVTFTFMSNGPTGSFNDATINPNTPSDFGDAPATYGQARHKFDCAGGLNSEKVYLGATVDYEPGSINSKDAAGDDNSFTGATAVDDEDGVTFPAMPLSIKSTSYSVVVNAFRSASLATAPTLYGWIDFNKNGVFESNEVATAFVSITGHNNYTLTWNGLSCASLTPGNTYCRFRITTTSLTDDLSTTGTDERASGNANDGEVEDYKLPIMGVDYGDAPAGVYGTPVSLVYPDLDLDNVPDAPDAIWLGTIAQATDGAAPCTPNNNLVATGDDNDGVNDEDGCVFPNGFYKGDNTITFVANGNTHGQTGYYGLWIDWNSDGFQNTANEFYSGSFTVGSPVTINQTVNAPVTITTASQIYARIRVATSPLTYADYNTVLANSETEDYFKPSITILAVSVIDFNATKQGNNALLKWQTSSEQDNAGFNIQHSTDGRNWQTIGFVSGAGNSNVLTNYSYVHANISKGIHYYRLDQVDINQHHSLSAVRKVNIGENYIVQVYPNPVKEKLSVVTDNNAVGGNLEVCNISGQKIISKAIGAGTNTVDVARLAKGVYILRLIYNNEEPFYYKFIKE
jgi:hypothetical protein